MCVCVGVGGWEGGGGGHVCRPGDAGGHAARVRARPDSSHTRAAALHPLNHPPPPPPPTLARACSTHPSGGWGEAAELEWGREGYLARASALAPADLVLSSDACYIDQDGASPSTPAFVAAAAALCAPHTICLVAFERRAPEVRQAFVAAARAAFSRVDLLPLGGAVAARALRLDYVDLWRLQL